MSFILSKLRSFLPDGFSVDEPHKRHSVGLEPEVGFQLTLEPHSTVTGDSNVPELIVNLIAARHLPSMFGLKSVQGYIIKVKLFPGSRKFDSTIQTCSWPKFNEVFRFPLSPSLKPAIKNYSKDKKYITLPEKCFSGHFVVFTVYALLELPSGTFDRFKGTYRSLREKGASLLKAKADTTRSAKDNDKEKQDESNSKLTKSETKRNLGSVTCYLDAKIFQQSSKGIHYLTEEIWLPIKEITVTPSKTYNVNASLKGQIELILGIFDNSNEESSDDENSKNRVMEESCPMKRPWSLTEVKKKMKSGKSPKASKDLCLRIITSKMRCSIKVKDEFEATAGLIYIKTSVFHHEILVNSWKSENFLPTLSTRWDEEQSKIEIPLVDEKYLEGLSIKTTVATKTKVGKKIILGTVVVSPAVKGFALEHWRSMTSKRNEPIAMYHNFL